MTRSRPTSRARRWLAGLSALAIVGAVGLISAGSVAAAEPANPVLDWNINAVNAIGNPTRRTPSLASASRRRSP